MLSRTCLVRAAVLAAGSLALAGGQTALAQSTAKSGQTLQSAIHDAFHVDRYDLVNLDIPAAPADHVVMQVPVEGANYTLMLDRHSLRSPDFRARVQLADGSLQEIDAPPVTTFRGFVDEIPGSIVTASFIDGTLSAQIITDFDLAWTIQPAREADKTAASELHVVYANGDAHADHEWQCGADHIEQPFVAEPILGGGGFGARGVCEYQTEIAFDADVEFYNRNGQSVAATIADIELIMNNVEVIYNRDVGIGYLITETIIRTNETDPYSSTNASTLLNQFRSHWNASQRGVHRDIAHLMTGKNIQGGTIGIAWLSVICNSIINGNGYGLSESRFTSNLNFRTGLTAHELGHNWSSGHCDGSSTCWIMCSGIGGCAGSVTKFGTNASNTIINYRNSRGCLDQIGAVPPMGNDDFTDTFFDLVKDIDVLANDTGGCNDLNIQLNQAFSDEGGLIQVTGGIVRYTPPFAANGTLFTGIDRFTYDVFNGDGSDGPIEVSIDVRPPRAPENPPFTEPGLNVDYYALSAPTQLPDFSSLTPISSELVDRPRQLNTAGDFMGSGRNDDVGAVFTGYVTVPETGTYTFYLLSDEGSRLSFGNDLVVDHDGLHSLSEMAGVISLEAGTHQFTLEYFEATGAAGLIVQYEGPTISKISIPASAYSHAVDGCIADWNGDGNILTSDFVAYLNDYNAVLGGGSPIFGDPDLAAPIGVLNTADFLEYLNQYNAGCP